ncbi:probable LRR receptor-like serine/threonine-protein kinase At1g51810 isoform X2 [Arabidopsis lyrata subsp. lyrata]|uniref:probable LRR receptor-like serine/threonine-protein kinase At1g51810 isoform X2 n=1 Tax=Arabidopsis lyrata subsp. lyrata TaxID=81972 RepID=UPI000A29EA93|nr:probable LRR receptor-like serine/threonine-protein kinase At1g51810 isoform X2 [Arabidopsis lyrata subsp. lyrata]|eukprot:XP_020870267.1 probable LRR receptor-like serine/threonine-protein kinase At1g51810 isoform X2 [Arabidopsis lyrata subsp. lyrata]
MERYGVFFVILLHLLHLVQAQDQNGFISLDCGLSPNDSPYEEPETKLIYTSDADLIQGGRTGRVEETSRYFIKPSWTLRYFPDGVRNCYNLNVMQGTRYMIRAIFIYGNYDGLNVDPSFDLYFGPNLWKTVCLVKTGTSTPMINVLELRPLRTDMYITKSKSLQLLGRNYFRISEAVIRYPDDVYDRLWAPGFLEDEWAPFNTTINITSSSYDLPQSVMANAITPLDPKKSLNITLNISSDTTESPTTEFYLYMHFAELQTLKANETRKFNILIDGKPIFDNPYSPKFLTADSLQDPTPQQCDEGSCNFELAKTWDSNLPPLINAIEGFTEIDFSLLETNGADVAAIKRIQSAYRLNKISWQGDPCVPKKFLWDGLKCNSFDNSTSPIITFLNLSSSSLNGSITSAIQNLTNLQELDLSNNNLTGGIPGFLADMKSLLVINLSRNNLNGPVPKKLIEKKGLKLNVEGNPKIICTTRSCVNGAREGGHQKNNIIVPVSASIAALVILIIASILCCVLIKKEKPINLTFCLMNLEPTSCMLNTDVRSSRSAEPAIMTTNKRFTYSEVVKMTNNFQRILGKGGFGIVYYGSVNDTEEVAVKMLSQSSSQGYKQFKAEVELLLRVHHKNLVGLVGYCDEGDKLALIYEYMANGDLDEHMSGKRGGSFLNWATRLKIVAESAQGLEYLHNGCKPLMVHRDIKTTNILLNEHLQAKLADFGLSRSFPIEGETHVSTVVAGTIGYLDPEYYRTNWLTEKSDVYSFGIVILEIITNKPVIDQNREKRHIAEWVGQMLTKGDIKSITDPSLHGDYDSSSVWKAVELAMSCLNPSSINRPTMTQVVSELNECLASENLRGGQSQEMDSQSSIEVSMTFEPEANPAAR